MSKAKKKGKKKEKEIWELKSGKNEEKDNGGEYK